MKRRGWVPLVLWIILGMTFAAAPAWAGHLILSVSDGKYPMIDGVYQVERVMQP